MTKCCICHRPQLDMKRCEVLTLTPEERQALTASGQPDTDKLVYCKPCYRIATDRKRGAAFMKGLAETALRRAGVADAEARAQKFHDQLLAKAKP